jgi:hypothetical protein
MSKVTVFQSTKYDINHDQSVKYRRWGTREAIEAKGCHVLEHTATEVDASAIVTDEPGFAVLGFNPHAFSSSGMAR